MEMQKYLYLEKIYISFLHINERKGQLKSYKSGRIVYDLKT